MQYPYYPTEHISPDVRAPTELILKHSPSDFYRHRQVVYNPGPEIGRRHIMFMKGNDTLEGWDQNEYLCNSTPVMLIILSYLCIALRLCFNLLSKPRSKGDGGILITPTNRFKGVIFLSLNGSRPGPASFECGVFDSSFSTLSFLTNGPFIVNFFLSLAIPPPAHPSPTPCFLCLTPSSPLLACLSLPPDLVLGLMSKSGHKTWKNVECYGLKHKLKKCVENIFRRHIPTNTNLLPKPTSPF